MLWLLLLITLSVTATLRLWVVLWNFFIFVSVLTLFFFFMLTYSGIEVWITLGAGFLQVWWIFQSAVGLRTLENCIGIQGISIDKLIALQSLSLILFIDSFECISLLKRWLLFVASLRPLRRFPLRCYRLFDFFHLLRFLLHRCLFFDMTFLCLILFQSFSSFHLLHHFSWHFTFPFTYHLQCLTLLEVWDGSFELLEH